MLATDTIVAVASGWGRSPRALIRMSGPGVDGILGHHFGADSARPRSNRASIVPAIFSLPAASPGIGSHVPLPCLVLRYGAPRSYTTQDAAEILLPGNPALVERVLAAMLRTPGEEVREATPGEFSARAYLAGRLTLEQAEGIAAVIGAQSEDELRAGRRLLDGEAGREYRAWMDELATLLALVEAGIDFTDQEDVVPITAADLALRLGALGSMIRSRQGVAAGREDDGHEPRVVIAGKPNAGKSTLFNALLGRRRTVVSEIAGTTRDVIAEPLDLSGDAPGGSVVRLCDLAGLDSALLHSESDRAAQSLARQAVAGADVVIYADPTGRFDPGLLETGAPMIRVKTKSDLPAPVGTAPATPDHSVCALDGRGLGPLRRAIADAAWKRGPEGAGLPARHRRSLTQAAASLARASEAIGIVARGSPLNRPELIADALRGAMDCLGEISGRVTPDDVIGRIFSTFCVGK